MPLALQVKLLRFLQDGRLERVGGRELIPVDTRILAATNMNLKEAIELSKECPILEHDGTVEIREIQPLQM